MAELLKSDCASRCLSKLRPSNQTKEMHSSYPAEAWGKEQKSRQNKARVNAVIFEKVLKGNASKEVLEQRKARREQRTTKKEEKRREKNGNRGEIALNERPSVDLPVVQSGDNKITPGRRSCNTICGLIDMYKQETESEFSKMEKRTANIIKILERDIANGRESSQLSHAQLRQIHHFLFIMFYRGSNFYKHYNTTMEAYKGSDKDSLLAYMTAKGFTQPLEVWYHNFRVFLELPLGPDLEAWRAELRAKAYPIDANHFIDHVEDYYLCFCRPRQVDDALIITQNAFGVYDGTCAITERWRFFHFFAPISPKFMILLRARRL